MKHKILIIDDSVVDRKIIGKIIQKNIEEVDIIESQDGQSIVDLIKTNEIMMCILDLRMPNIDGIEVLKMIKADQATSDVPVIVCTGVLDVATMERVLSLGAYDYFTKPFSEEDMKFSLPLKVRNAVELSKRTNHILLMSQTDDLTGLYNRIFFKKYIDSVSFNPNDYPITIMMIDINGLKVINDAYGSFAGDRFLIKTADILKKSLPIGSINARWGGDEFVSLIPNLSNAEANKMVKKINLMVSKVTFKGLNLNLAIGTDTLINTNENLLKVLKNAEDAMIRDKILDDGSVRSAMIATILHTLNVKNPREEAHSRRVSELCVKMGIALEMNEQEIQDLKVIGLLHDIGKIAIDEKILNKPGALTDDEYAEIKRHPEIGYRILSASKDMDRYLEVILSHHERYDGKGYPNGLIGMQIPMMSRILMIIDSFDAMTCLRPYRATKGIKEATDELVSCSGKQFDGALVDVFINRVVNTIEYA